MGPGHPPSFCKLRHLIDKRLDDISVATDDFETHLLMLTEASQALKEADLEVNYKECGFGKIELVYLGY